MLKEPPLILLILPPSVFVNRPIRSVIYVTNKLEVPDFLTIIGYIVVKIRYLKWGKEKHLGYLIIWMCFSKWNYSGLKLLLNC